LCKDKNQLFANFGGFTLLSLFAQDLDQKNIENIRDKIEGMIPKQETDA
jgi:hypothetical protein